MAKIALLDCCLLPAELERYGSIGKVVTDWLCPFLPEASFETFAIAEGAAFPDLADHDGFILPGSEAGVYDDTPWMEPLRNYLLAIRQSGKPLLGICFGHQMMAHTFGGRAAKADHGMCTGTRSWRVEGETFDALVMHQDQVIELPPGARVIGSADYCPYGVIAYDFPALSMQFHPEYETAFIETAIDVLESRGLDDGEAESARQSLSRKVRENLYAEQAAAFFRQYPG